MDNFEETAHAVPMTSMQDVRCYTVEDLMAMLALSRPTVYRLLKQGQYGPINSGNRQRKVAIEHGALLTGEVDKKVDFPIGL